MPIKPENRSRYPADWKEISRRIRFDRAGNACECVGECGSDHRGRCSAPNHQEICRETDNPASWVLDIYCGDGEWIGTPSCGEPNGAYPRWRRPITVILTVGHLDHKPENCDDANLRAWCQRCHLRYDREHHAKTRRKTRAAKTGQGDLF